MFVPFLEISISVTKNLLPVISLGCSLLADLLAQI